ncbi:MAG: dephospho-CoA kinase [Acidobacteria bacterium]|nr:MAG: dephospho-CoA kinase [Acidobacteriota bacterium]
MLKVALTGNMCSGKSTVGRMLRELGVYLFDADSIIRGFYEERGDVYRAVVEAFGIGILDPSGGIDRKRLADMVFSNPGKLAVLESITHQALYKRLEGEFKGLLEGSVAVVEASLLIEKGTYRNYHVILLVYAPYEVCKKRALLSGYSEEDFERRWRLQMPPEEKLRYAHFIIDNTGTVERLRERVFEVYRVLKNWSEHGRNH